MADNLTGCATAGYSGADNPHMFSSPAFYAHALGAFLLRAGRPAPVEVRMSRGYSIRADGARYAIRDNVKPVELSRVEG